MRRGYQFWERLADRAELETEPIPLQTIIEIAGDRRLLIENHGGVKAYGSNRILVNVRYGAICACGSELEIIRMSKTKLIIRGRIDSVSLLRRVSP